MGKAAYLESLDLPDSFESVLQDNRLPLAYLPAEWLVLVCTDASRGEYAFTKGGSLHRNWESSHLHAFSASSLNFPPGALQVLCPDEERILAIKVTSQFPSRRSAQGGEANIDKPRIKLKPKS